MKRRLSPLLIIGIILFSLGGYLAYPRIYAQLFYQFSFGYIAEIYPKPLADGQIELALVYEFTINGDEIGYQQGQVVAYGYGQCDAFGRPLENMVVDPSTAQHLVDVFARGNNTPFPVYYDEADPLGSARLYMDNGGNPLWQFEVGILLMVSPLLMGLGILYARRVL